MATNSRGKKNQDVMPVHLGNILAKKIKERRYTKAAIARYINRTVNALNPMLKQPSVQCYVLWELCIALNYDFFEYLSEQLKQEVGDKLESANAPLQQRIAQLEKENETLQTNNAYFKKAIDAMGK